MSSLREIKDRIGSIRSTLKITGAMKLVASVKFRKAERSLKALRPYESTLISILEDTISAARTTIDSFPSAQIPPDDKNPQKKVAVVALASNSSLCGSFNSNILRKVEAVLEHLDGNADIFAIGRKIADPLRKAGFPSPAVPIFASDPSSSSSSSSATPPSVLDLNDLAAHPTYEAATHLATALVEAYNSGKYAGVVLIYNRFISSSKQEVVLERYLPFEAESPAVLENSSSDFAGYADSFAEGDPDYIFEPSAKEIIAELKPKILSLRIYSMLLNSITAEHAARIIAMQTASDNAQDLLDDLTLEYNKERQQQITSEILDIVGGSQQ